MAEGQYLLSIYAQVIFSLILCEVNFAILLYY